jgi:hypothetical protein
VQAKRAGSSRDGANQLAHLIINFVGSEHCFADFQPEDRAEPLSKTVDRDLDGSLGELEPGCDGTVRGQFTTVGQGTVVARRAKVLLPPC